MLLLLLLELDGYWDLAPWPTDLSSTLVFISNKGDFWPPHLFCIISQLVENVDGEEGCYLLKENLRDWKWICGMCVCARVGVCVCVCVCRCMCLATFSCLGQLPSWWQMRFYQEGHGGEGAEDVHKRDDDKDIPQNLSWERWRGRTNGLQVLVGSKKCWGQCQEGMSWKNKSWW